MIMKQDICNNQSKRTLTFTAMGVMIVMGIIALLLTNPATVYANSTIRNPNHQQHQTHQRHPSVTTWNQGQQGNRVQGNTIHGLNADGRPNAINQNDHHTNVWDRFSHNYIFTSGPDFRHVLGSPTYVSAGQVRQDPATQNVRRDRNVAQMPLPYGIFSAIVETYHANPTFATWVNLHGGLPFVLENPNVLEQFDTMLLGINNLDWQNPNPVNMFNVGQGQEPMIMNTSQMPPGSLGNNSGFLPPTSIDD